MSEEDEERNLYQYLVEPRYERIGGILYAMSSPKYWHQEIIGGMYFQLRSQLDKYGCHVFMSPFDVYVLADLGDDKTFVEPDLFISCDQNKLEQLVKREQTHYHGAPSIIIEVLSAANRTYDLVTKRDLYERSGVKEYWAVDPDEKLLYIFIFNEGSPYKIIDLAKEPSVSYTEIPGCMVDFRQIF
ncbi:hypothetical protein FACS1894151_04250 [Spirochaetia bacterium]|nr:hypothetical protein FACS1894151_04250 [Spirochaetia bacterium]